MKGLYQRKKIWYIRFTPASGEKQRRICLGTSDEAEAIQEARKITDRISRAVHLEAQASSKDIQDYLTAKKKAGLSKNTLSSRSYVLQAFCRDMDVTGMRLVSTPTVQRWHDKVHAIKPHTAGSYVTILSGFFKWMVLEGRAMHNPCEGIKRPKLPMRRRKSFLLHDQAHKLIELCKDPDLRFALYCGLHAGMRKNEVIEARPEWFDLDQKLIHIQATPTFEPKDRDNRTIPLTDEFRDWLRKEFPLPGPFCFRPDIEHGKSKYRSDFQKSFNTHKRACGLHSFTFHDLRRTFASLHVSRGTSIYKVAKWLGDLVEVVEGTYGHLIPQDEEINNVWTKKKAAQEAASPASPPHSGDQFQIKGSYGDSIALVAAQAIDLGAVHTIEQGHVISAGSFHH